MCAGSEPEVTEAADSSDDFAQEVEGVPTEPVDQVQRIDLTALEGVREAPQGEHSPSERLAGPASAQAVALASRLRARRHSAATASLPTTDVEFTGEPTDVAASSEETAPRKVPVRTPGVTAFASAAATGSAVDGQITTKPGAATDAASQPQEATSAPVTSVVAPEVVAGGADLAESQPTSELSEAPAAVSLEDQRRIPSSASTQVYVVDAAAGSASPASMTGAPAAQADNGEGGEDIEVEDVQAGEYVNLATVMDGADGADVVDLRVRQGTELDAMKHTPDDSAEPLPETTHEAPAARQSVRTSSPVRGADADPTPPANVEGLKQGAKPVEDAAELALPSSDVDLDRRFQNWQAGELDGAVDLELPAARPTGGWRKAALSLSGGIYNPGPSKQEVQAAQQRAFLRTSLRGNRHVAVVSMAGGVGKTITAGFLGQAWGEARGDRVCAIDANPDAGNLAERFAGQTIVGADGRPVRALLTVRDLLTDDAIAPVDSVADLSNYMTIAGRLHILPAPASVDDVLSAQEYRRAQAIADRFYNLTIIDTGTSIAHETHRAILELADDLVFVVGPSMDAARRVKAMMDDLQARGYGDLLARATVMVITRSSAESSLARSRRGGGVDPATLASYFARRVRDVVRVPYSRALSDGMAADFAQLSEDIRIPYLEAAAGIAAHFNGPKTPAPILSRQRVPRVTSAQAAQAARGRRWPGLGARAKAGEPLPPTTMKVTTSSGQDIQDLDQLDELDALPRYGRREEYLNDRRD